MTKEHQKQCFWPFKPPFHPFRGWFLKNPFLVVTYITIGTYIPNFTFLAAVVSALRRSSVSQLYTVYITGQKPWWNWYLTPVVNFGKVRMVQLAKSTFISTWCPWDLSDLLRSTQTLKKERGAESNGKLLHLCNPWWNCSHGSLDCGGRPAFGRTAS